MKEIFKTKIGAFACTIIKDLMFPYAVKDYFNNVEPDELSTALQRYSIASESLELPYSVMLLEKEDKKILIDSGIGYSDKPIKFGEADFYLRGSLLKNLENQGINTSEITDVIISHFHPDHIGGIFSDGQLNFPNATFHFSEKEWNFWHSSSADNFPALFGLFIENNVTPLKSQNVNIIKGDFTTVLPGIVSINAAGHSAGQIALVIGEGNNQMLYAADTFLHPLHVEHISWKTIYDFDHDKSEASRKKLATLALENDLLVHAYHFDFPSLGKIGSENNKWVWKYMEKH